MATLTIYDGYQFKITYHGVDNVPKEQAVTKLTMQQCIDLFQTWFATKYIVIDTYLMLKGKFVVYNGVEIPIEPLVLVDDAVEPWIDQVADEIAQSVANQQAMEADERAQLAYLKEKYPLTPAEEIALRDELLIKYPL